MGRALEYKRKRSVAVADPGAGKGGGGVVGGTDSLICRWLGRAPSLVSSCFLTTKITP